MSSFICVAHFMPLFIICPRNFQHSPARAPLCIITTIDYMVLLMFIHLPMEQSGASNWMGWCARLEKKFCNFVPWNTAKLNNDTFLCMSWLHSLLPSSSIARCCYSEWCRGMSTSLLGTTQLNSPFAIQQLNCRYFFFILSRRGTRAIRVGKMVPT